MTRRAVPAAVARALARYVVLVTAVLVLLVARAHADNVDKLISQLEDSSTKVRIGAALNLTKLGDPRAVLPLVKRVNVDNESDKNVRGAAAVGLGKLAKDVKPNIKKLAIAALDKAAKNDPSPFVQAQAEKALEALGGAGGGSSGTSGGGSGKLYVNIGPMSSKTGSNDAKFKALMVETAKKTMGRAAPSMLITWPGGKTPTKSDLGKGGYAGFYVDGTLNELKSDGSGTVTCKISMLLASFPDKSVFGFLSGGAKVQGGSSPRDIELAKEDCVAAVVEDLIAKKIVPTIKLKAP